MPNQEWSQITHNDNLNVDLLHAFYIEHAYPRHSHDYYVICVIEQGLQSFWHNGKKHITPPGGVILINPGDVHTGEAVDNLGFKMRSIYPTLTHMQTLTSELTGHPQKLPFFNSVRVDDHWARECILAIHETLTNGSSALECESSFTWNLARLIRAYADLHPTEPKLGREQKAIELARSYIEDCYSVGVTLTELAAHVSLSPYYLIRSFRAEVGMPPHAYLESVRIRHTQRLIEEGRPLAEVASDVGFSSQSHMNRSFKKIIGVSPGQYAQQFR